MVQAYGEAVGSAGTGLKCGRISRGFFYFNHKNLPYCNGLLHVMQMKIQLAFCSKVLPSAPLVGGEGRGRK